ncbi:hypothetical protein BG74_06540 [Sodalis-like endosymbiont of Proechinophthirus fluctus]|nr:hypothetical protein BG74_06540 [Sodalis-like endosymbiont of Proechinophthirus fluctus]
MKTFAIDLVNQRSHSLTDRRRLRGVNCWKRIEKAYTRLITSKKLTRYIRSRQLKETAQRASSHQRLRLFTIEWEI